MDSGQQLRINGGVTTGIHENILTHNIPDKKPSVDIIQFKKLDLKEIDKISPAFEYSLSRACDNTKGGAFMWRDYFATEYAVYNYTTIFKVRYINGKTAFSMPLGPDIPGSLEKIKEYCEVEGIPLMFCTATEADLAVYGKYFDIEYIKEPDWGDYLYRASDLATLKGRKYNGQRNHINYFKRNNPSWVYEDLTAENVRDVEEFYKNSTLIDSKPTGLFLEEQNKVFEVLQKNDIYKLLGGLIRIEGKVIAFALGEVLKDTLYVHIEKADTSIRGSYQMIVNQFAQRYASESVKLINREEDVGDEGLRKSKLSYHPCEIIEKHTVKIKQDE